MVKTSGMLVGPKITDRLHVIMRDVKTNTTQSISNRVEIEAGGGIVMKRIDTTEEKSASQSILHHDSPLTIPSQAKERQI